jgi:hypothetical protein
MEFLTFISACKGFQPIIFFVNFFQRIRTRQSNFAIYDTHTECLPISFLLALESNSEEPSQKNKTKTYFKNVS